MAKTIKVKCNGPGKHLNEVDLDKALKTDVVLRGGPATAQRRIPERLIWPCQFCTKGKVIITRQMIEENL